MSSSTSVRPAAVRIASVLVAIALAGCGSGPAVQDRSSPPASGATSFPTQTATPPASSGSTGPAAAPGWRWQRTGDSFALGPGETVYTTGTGEACEHALDALDGAGAELAGWPYCATPGGWPDFVTVDQGGTAYIAAGGETVVGLRIDGTPGASWPQGFGWLVGTRDDGIVLVKPSPTTLSELVAYDATGKVLPGWPVKVPGAIVDTVGASPAGSLAVGSDGSAAVLYRDPSTGYRWVTVIEPDGRTRPGWPVLVPNEMDGRSIALDLVTSDGRIVLRSHEPWPVIDSAAVMAGLQGQVAVIGPDGTIPDGWPVRFEEPLSPVVEGKDGRLYAIAGDVVYGATTGQPPTGPYSAVALDRDGRTPTGWPVPLPDDGITPLAPAQTPGPVPPWAQPPVVGDDGSLVVGMGGWEGPHGIVWIETDGTIALTHRLPDGMEISNGQPSTPSGPPLAPVLVGDRAFLAVTLQAGARIDDADRPVGIGAPPGSLVSTEGVNDFGSDVMLAVDRGGPVAGWPLALPEPGFVNRFDVTPGGLLVVSVSGDPGYIAAADAWAGGD